MVRSSIREALALSLFLCLVGATSARAEPRCIPDAIASKGRAGPIQRWASSASVDARVWQDALQHEHLNEHVGFRALRYAAEGQAHLLLAWDVRVDSGPADGAGDTLTVGFWDEEKAQGNLIRLRRATERSVEGGRVASKALHAELAYADSETTQAFVPILSEQALTSWAADDLRIDTSCERDVCKRWRVRMRIPLDRDGVAANPIRGLPLPDTFRMWYELQVENAGPTVTRYKWPRAVESIGSDALLPYPDPRSWHQVKLGGLACVPGLALEAMQVTTDNAVSTEIATVDANVFHARPLNNTGNTVPGDAVSAHFRLADWGSAPLGSPAWVEIEPSQPTCAQATGAPVSIPHGGHFDLSCSWTLTDAQQCAYRPDFHSDCSPMPEARNRFQCISATLTSEVVPIAVARAARCMRFVSASRFEETAMLSVEGLPPLTEAVTRDVYVHVATENMPATISDPSAASNAAAAPAGAKVMSSDEGHALERRARRGHLGQRSLSRKVPTYVVHAYYDTGERIVRDGKPYPVTEPMQSFGYYVLHDGPLAGWRHELAAPDLERLRKDSYRVPIPHGGRVEMEVAIRSVVPGEQDDEPDEPKVVSDSPQVARTTPLWVWWVAGGIGFIVAGAMVRRKGRK